MFFCCFFFQTVFQTEQQAKGPTRRRFDFVSLLLSLQRRVFSFSQSPAASAGGEWVERVGFILFFFVFFCFSGVPGGLMSRPSLNQQHSRLTWGSVGNPHQIELLEMAHHTHPPTHPPILCVCVCVCVLLCVALYRVGFGWFANGDRLSSLRLLKMNLRDQFCEPLSRRNVNSNWWIESVDSMSHGSNGSTRDSANCSLFDSFILIPFEWERFPLQRIDGRAVQRMGTIWWPTSGSILPFLKC